MATSGLMAVLWGTDRGTWHVQVPRLPCRQEVAMTTDERTKPADMTIPELDAALAKLTEAKAEAPTATRKLVISSLIDRLLDERSSRHQP
jgi:hypothetical protein